VAWKFELKVYDIVMFEEKPLADEEAALAYVGWAKQQSAFLGLSQCSWIFEPPGEWIQGPVKFEITENV